jgi:hypothetical protein
MPCNSDYLDANPFEQTLGRVRNHLDELEGKKIKYGNDGYREDVYNKHHNKDILDKAVRELCQKCSSLGPKIKNYSLELQMWWRDHQKADAQRQKLEREEQEKKHLKKTALSKLSQAERQALGVRDDD